MYGVVDVLGNKYFPLSGANIPLPFIPRLEVVEVELAPGKED
jgi:hypothetical protein